MVSNKERRIQNRVRDAHIVQHCEAGWSYSKIGEKYGLSKNRVRSIWKKELRLKGDRRGYGYEPLRRPRRWHSDLGV